MSSEPTDDETAAPRHPRRLAWRPRKQSPADSYTSLSRFRDAAREEARRQSGEAPADRTAARPAPLFAPDETGPLPRPGAPLFGPRGLITGPLAAPKTPLVPLFPAGETAPGDTSVRVTTRFRADIDVILPAEADDAPELELRTFTPSAPLRRARRPRWLAAVVSLALIAVIAVIAARPLGSVFAAHVTLSGLPPFGSQHAAPVATAGPSYTPAALDTDHPPPVLFAESAVVMDETNGTILYAKNPNEQLPMASTTKLMTAVVALAHASPDTVITVTQDAADTGGERIVLQTGEQYTLRELLYGMLLPSGNDAAEAIADGIGGNLPTFLGWMNATAATLGLDHTHYVNPHGLDDAGQYSSAHDLAVLGRYALSIPLIQQITATRTYTIPATAHHARHDLLNMHQPLWWYPGADGGKPGWTGAAQFVDVLSAARDGHHLLAVVMHSENDWVTDIRDLLNWGFDDFRWISPRDIVQQQPIPFAAAYQNFAWDLPSRTVSDGQRRYYPYTGFTLAGPFLAYFDQRGGLTNFGFPRGMPTPGATGQLVQTFDKALVACIIATGVCQVVPGA